jgi:hypothetical protein
LNGLARNHGVFWDGMGMQVTIFVSGHDILQLLTVLFDLKFNDFAEDKSTHVLAWKLLL